MQNESSEARSPAVWPKFAFGLFLVVAFGFLIFKPYDNGEMRPIDKPRKPPKKVAAGSSELWFGVRVKVGPPDASTGKPFGVLVTQVLSGSPAEASGLVAQDLILKFNKTKTPTPKALAMAMNKAGANKAVSCRIQRGRKLLTIDIKLESKGSEKIANTAIDQAILYLLTRQNEDGSFSHFTDEDRASPSVTAFVAWALACHCGNALEGSKSEARQDAQLFLEAALEYLEKMILPNGALNTSEWNLGHRTYGMSCAILAMARTNKDKYRDTIQKMAKFLLSTQIQESNGYNAVDWHYGGFPYYESVEINRLRTDISTLAFVVEALEAAEIPANHPCWRRIGLFLDESQNFALLSTTPEQQKLEAEIRDGGFSFSPRASKALIAETLNQQLNSELTDLSFYKSYGSATADGLRSLITVDGSASHDRAVAALNWLARHYQLRANPELETSGPTPWGKGLYYYYLNSMSRAFFKARVARIELKPEDEDQSKAVVHHWPAELIRELARLQKPEGYWQSSIALMGEDSPVIATAFSLLALDSAVKTLQLTEVMPLTATKAAPAPVLDKAPATNLPNDPIERGIVIARNERCFSCHKDRETDNAPSLVGVGDRFLKKFQTASQARSYMRKHIRDPKQYPGTRKWDGGVEMPPYSATSIPAPHLEDLITFLLSRTGKKRVAKATLKQELEAPKDSDVGFAVYRKLNCQSCHFDKNQTAPSLDGVYERYLKHAKSPKKAEQQIAAFIRNPRKEKPLGKYLSGGAKMVPYTKAMLSDQDLADLVHFLKTRKKS